MLDFSFIYRYIYLNMKDNNELSEKEQELAKLVGVGIVLGVVLFLIFLRAKGIIPGPDIIVSYLETLYTNYGYPVVFISALIEGLVLVNLYFPGSTAIILGVIFASRSELSVPLVVALAIGGFLISYTANYFIGRHGLNKLLKKCGYEESLKNIQNSLKEKGGRAILSSYFHPNLAALVSTGAGLIGMPYLKFIGASALALILWDSLWAFVAFQLGERALKLFESWYIIPVTILWSLLAFYLAKRNSMTTLSKNV